MPFEPDIAKIPLISTFDDLCYEIYDDIDLFLWSLLMISVPDLYRKHWYAWMTSNPDIPMNTRKTSAQVHNIHYWP